MHRCSPWEIELNKLLHVGRTTTWLMVFHFCFAAICSSDSCRFSSRAMGIENGAMSIDCIRLFLDLLLNNVDRRDFREGRNGFKSIVLKRTKFENGNIFTVMVLACRRLIGSQVLAALERQSCFCWICCAFAFSWQVLHLHVVLYHLLVYCFQWKLK